LAVDLYGLHDLLKRVFANGAVMAGLLDVQKTSIGVEADLTKFRKVMQPPADAEVVSILDRGLRT
jgi:hypothetical protein